MGILERLAGQPCENCAAKKKKWHQQSDQSQHAYKVNCSGCERFLKWGTQDEFELLSKYNLTEFVAYSPEQLGRTLDEFFE